MYNSSIHESRYGLIDVFLETGEKIKVLAIDKEDGRREIIHARPQVIRGNQNAPEFSLTILLSRMPTVNEETISHLIQSGILNFKLGLGVQQEVLEKLSCMSNGAVKRVFTDPLILEFCQKSAEETSTITRFEGAGATGIGTLEAQLSKDQVLQVWDALLTKESGLLVKTKVYFKDRPEGGTVIIRGSWAEIYDGIQEKKRGETIVEGELKEILYDLYLDGIIEIVNEENEPISTSADSVFNLMRSHTSIILQRVTTLHSTEYTLKNRPFEGIQLNYKSTLTQQTKEYIEFSHSLEEIIGNLLADQTWEDFVHLIANDSHSRFRYQPVGKRLVVKDRSRGRTNTVGANAVGLHKNQLMSMTALTLPSTGATFINKPEYIHSLTSPAIYSLDNLKITVDADEKILSLPIVDALSKPYWQDRKNPNQVWYAPDTALIKTVKNSQDNTGLFQFYYWRTGSTASGKPSLSGWVKFSLQLVQSTDTKAAIQKEKIRSARMLPIKNIKCRLLVPFIDDKDGNRKVHSLNASVQREGNIIHCRVRMQNDWVRVVYNALSTENIASQQASISLSYSFDGYQIVRKEGQLNFVYGGKISPTVVNYSEPVANLQPISPVFNASNFTLVGRGFELKYNVEHADRSDRNAPRGKSVFSAATINRPTSLPNMLSAAYVMKPDLLKAVEVKEYAIQSFLIYRVSDCFFDCHNYGHHYQEKLTDGGVMEIGCRDALKLGNLEYVSYTEIIDLRQPEYKVYKSLSQPGYYIVNPTSYCIGRKGSGEEEPYRPLIFVNVVVDALHANRNIYELRTTLQPDIPYYKLQKLKQELSALHYNPVIEYPNELVLNNHQVSWVVDNQIEIEEPITDLVNADGPFISALFKMNIANWFLLRRVIETIGLKGTLKVTLEDGMQFESNLNIKTDAIRGPWMEGPIKSENQGTIQKIKNMLEHDLELLKITGTNDQGHPAEEIIEDLIPSEAEYTLQQKINNPAIIYEIPEGVTTTIEETRSFIEEVETNLIFTLLTYLQDHLLVRIHVEAKILGVDQVELIQLTQEMATKSVTFLLPVTMNLEELILQLTIVKEDVNGQLTPVPLQTINLNSTTIIGINSTMLGLDGDYNAEL